MSKNEVVEALVKEASHNAVAKAMFNVFALRQRARQFVSVHGLKQRMTKEGFNFTDREYSHVLYFMSKLGLGVAVLDKHGEVTALKDIKWTLQSIGEAGLGMSLELSAYEQKTQLKPLVPTFNHGELTAPSVSDVVITLTVNSKPISIPVPADFTAMEIALFIENIRKSNSSSAKDTLRRRTA